jgi:hypothetical protein
LVKVIRDTRSGPQWSIKQYLTDRRRKLRIFSIGQIIGESVDDCNFREKFRDYEVTVVIDLDERFAGWKIEICSRLLLNRRKCGSCWMGDYVVNRTYSQNILMERKPKSIFFE